MTKGRKLRLAFLASIVALLFGVVSVAHAGSHLGADNSRADSAAACTLCQHIGATHAAPAIVSAPVVTIDAVFLPVSTLLPAPAVRAHGTRGPPALR